MERLLRAVALILAVALVSSPLLAPALAPLVDPVHGLAGAAALPDRYSGILAAPGIEGEASVYYDDWLIPHIVASSEEAAFYAAGWVTASLRLFQMDLYRRVALGNLSSLVGEAGLESDKLSLTLGLRESVEETWRILVSDPGYADIVRALEAYSMGVNDYMKYAMEEGLLPAEYRLLGLKPEPWEPIHSLSISKLLSLMLAWDTDDLVLNELVRRHGADIIVNLDIINRSRNVAHAPCSEAIRVGDALAASKVDVSSLPPSGGLANRLSSLSWWSDASNNWVVSPGYTSSGAPLLANDPHLSLTSPPIWIILHIVAPGLNVAGVTVPGVPFIVIGRNLDVAWGFTNVGSDFVDFYYYTWSGGKYLYKGEWMEPDARTYKIKVWDPLSRSYTLEEVTVRSTIHGPLLEEGDEVFAVKFTGSSPGLEVVFVYLLNKASTVYDVLEAQRLFIAPIQNLVAADSSGNILYSPNGGYPKRVNVPIIETSRGPIANYGYIPFNGSAGEGEWDGFIPFEDLPALLNPELPFVATANSKPWEGQCGYGLGWNYADRFRTMRIQELLQDAITMGEKLDVEYMKEVQLDSRDYSIEAIARILLDVTPVTGETRDYLRMLEEWMENPSTSPDSKTAPLALAWTYYFHEAVWREVYGSAENRYFFKIEHLEALVEGYLSGEEWAKQYLGGKSLEQLSLDALDKARATLEEFFGGAEWAYAEFHVYKIENPVLKTDIAGDPAPGGPYSVNVAPPSSIDPSSGAPVSVGPSVRLISDLSTSIIHIALPGGQSGNPFSPESSRHYESLWLVGSYLELDLRYTGAGEPDIEFRGGGTR